MSVRCSAAFCPASQRAIFSGAVPETFAMVGWGARGCADRNSFPRCGQPRTRVRTRVDCDRRLTWAAVSAPPSRQFWSGSVRLGLSKGHLGSGMAISWAPSRWPTRANRSPKPSVSHPSPSLTSPSTDDRIGACLARPSKRLAQKIKQKSRPVTTCPPEPLHHRGAPMSPATTSRI
jgi:hypothetical protein